MDKRVLALVCGGRTFDNQPLMDRAMDRARERFGITEIVTGGQRKWIEEERRWIGADYQAGEWALSRCLWLCQLPADFTGKGRAGGPIRNQRMLDERRPDIGFSFPGSAGTADMVRRLRAAGIPVYEIGTPTP